MAKVKKKVWAGGNARVYIYSTFNNTIVNITDEGGNTYVWASAGSCGFKGTKKGTPYAAQIAASTAGKKSMEMGIKRVSVFVKGPGPGREVAIRGLQASGLVIGLIKDITPLPHDGCRPPKQRRV
jgi:small subunit ribosomal protein S11